jgi:hypothetical protein
MPRLPTILVIGSQAISTSWLSSTAVMSRSFFRYGAVSRARMHPARAGATWGHQVCL